MISPEEKGAGPCVKSRNDLTCYLNDEQVREEAQLLRDPVVRHVLKKEDVSLDWLAEELEGLAVVKHYVNELFTSYQYRIVYAVRLTENDLINIKNGRGMGYPYFGPVALKKIVAKCIVKDIDRKGLYSAMGLHDADWDETWTDWLNACS